MTTTTLTTDDLAVGEQVEIALVPGPQLVKLRVIASPGGGGGGVTAVTASAPLTSSGGPTPNIAIDASYPTVADFWPFDREIPANVPSPELAQAQATAPGVLVPVVVRTQAAFAGGGGQGRDLSFILGKDDVLGLKEMQFGYETAVGGLPPITNFFGMLRLQATNVGVVNASWGGGFNAIGGGVLAVTLDAGVPMAMATEFLSPITLTPSNGVGPHADFAHEVDGTNQPHLEVSSRATWPGATSGFFGLPWSLSSSSQDLIAQRDAADTTNLSIVSRQSGLLQFGNASENPKVQGQDTITLAVLRDGTGAQVVAPEGVIANFGGDNHATWVQGDINIPTRDSWVAQLYNGTTAATTANQTVASIPIPDGTEIISRLTVTLIARCAGTGDFASFEIFGCFSKSSGVITTGTGSPSPTDTGHSTAAVGIAPQLLASGDSILVQVTPWTASPTHWMTRVEDTVCTGAVPPPPAPPGSPIMWLRADTVALGPVATWTDQSGNGNSPATLGTPPVNTASVGPNASLPAIISTPGVTTGLTLPSSLGLPTKGFTIAFIIRTNNDTTEGQSLLCIGDTSSNGFFCGPNLGGVSSRDFSVRGVADSIFGTSTLAWEAWVVTSDAAGNLTALVNGAPVSVVPGNATLNAPSASLAIFATTLASGQFDGNCFEVIVWDTPQVNSQVYAYQHEVTGL